jgi:4-hydroxy-tetrahydrodipicolinate synthase
VDFCLRHGADGMMVLGVSGEGSKLGAEKSLSVASRFIQRAGAKPLIMGASNPSLAAITILPRR